METIKNMKKNTVSKVMESCVETVQAGWERTLARVLEWTRHPTEEDALSELARAELVFLALISALSSLDAEMSSLLLKEVEKWLLFPRITKYMAGKLEAEWLLPRDVIDRAAKFAVILERSGMFLVPQELHRYLAHLLLQEEDGGNEDSPSYEQKRPRKDPRDSLSQQGAESSIGGQASGGEYQVWRDVLVARRRRRRSLKVSREQAKKRKETHLHVQRSSSPTQEMARSIIVTTVEARGGRGQGRKGKQVPSHQQGLSPSAQEMTSSMANITGEARLSKGGRRKGKKEKQDSFNQQDSKPPPSQAVQNPASRVIPKVFKDSKTLFSKAVQNPATGAILKVCKDSKSLFSKAVQSPAAGAILKACKVTPTSSPTEEPQSPEVPMPSSSHQSEETLYSRAAKEINRANAQELLWKGVELDDELMIVVAAHNGADLEEEMGVGGWTPLTEAACYGRVGAVRALIRQGAWLDGRGVGQGTALFWASEMGHEAVVRELLAAGAIVRVENSYKATPLHRASVGGYLTIAKLLVEAGADLEAKDSKGSTPLAIAENSVAHYLRSVGAKH